MISGGGYMLISNKVIPVLVIEDKLEHFRAIKRVLEDAYQLEHFRDLEKDKLINYKALNQDNQIVIVDLNIKDSVIKGKQIIENNLWPVDRTTFFVIFSEHLDKLKSISPYSVNPHWTFVDKELTDGELNDECLTKLRQVIDKYSEYCNPYFTTPSFSGYEYIDRINQYRRENKHVSEHIRELLNGFVKESIADSITIINKCSETASSFSRAGFPSTKICIGIFGSCGRLEKRPKSDIEYVVYYEEDPDPKENLTLSVACWNRIMKFMIAECLDFEGAHIIKKNNPPILKIKDASTTLTNNYIPIISIDEILKKRLDKNPQIRDRHFQILTELRCIFNNDLCREFKIELLRKNIGQNVTSVKDIINSNYFIDIFSQYFRDSKPDQLETPKDWKKFCFRVLNLLALRLHFIEIISDNLYVASKGEWDAFLSGLCDPGIHKIIKFYIKCHSILDTNKSSQLQKKISTFIEDYVEKFDRLWKVSKVDTLESEDWPKLKLSVRQCVKKYVDIIKVLKTTNSFSRVHDVTWLFETNDVVEFSERL